MHYVARLCAFMAALLLVPAAAQAEWFEASSAHFVVYADDSKADITRFTQRLERYHDAMQVVTGVTVPPTSPSNRLVVFVVTSQGEVQKIYGTKDQALAGFYLPRAGASAAFIPPIGNATYSSLDPMTVLLHEYAHHFLISNSKFSAPRWFSEGAAEFFAATRFEDDGGLQLGLPAKARYDELLYARDITAEDLIDPAAYEKHRRDGVYDTFYGKSWLLYHYLVTDEARKGQLNQYLKLLVQGKSSRDAGIAAFGDLKQLNRDLDAYFTKKRLTSMRFQPGQLETGPVTVRQLSDGEAAILPVRIRSTRGVNKDTVDVVLKDARAIAAKYPGEPAVQSALAEAEYDAGNDDEAIAAADAALAKDPGQVNAYVQKGYALFRKAQAAKDKDAAYKEAMAPFFALNKLENDHPLPLYYYYRSFGLRGVQPSETAIAGLEQAAGLAPFDSDLTITLVTQYLLDAKNDRARPGLAALAYDPHNPFLPAANVLAALDSGTPQEPKVLVSMLGGGGGSAHTSAAATGNGRTPDDGGDDGGEGDGAGGSDGD